MKRFRFPRNTPFFILLLAVLVAVISVLLPDTKQSGVLTPSVHFIDVGQGDAALFVSGKEAVLIDGGPASASDAVVSYLKSQNVKTLKAIIATHPHEDHIGSLSAVMTAFPTETLYLTDRPASTRCYEKMLDAAEDTQVKVIVPEVGDVLPLDSQGSFTFLSPSSTDQWTDTNDWSIICRFDSPNMRILMTGDAGQAVEDALLKQEADFTCDIIKLGHHGSSTSSSKAFLQKTGARTAIISCGKDNTYGHPHQETLETLRALGISYRLTMEDGTIVIPLASAEGEAAA